MKYDGSALLPLPVPPWLPICRPANEEVLQREGHSAREGTSLPRSRPLSSLTPRLRLLFVPWPHQNHEREKVYVCPCPSASLCQQCGSPSWPEEGHFDHSSLRLTLRLTVLCATSKLTFISHCPARGQWQMSRQMCVVCSTRVPLRVSRFDRANRSIVR